MPAPSGDAEERSDDAAGARRDRRVRTLFPIGAKATARFAMRRRLPLTLTVACHHDRVCVSFYDSPPRGSSGAFELLRRTPSRGRRSTQAGSRLAARRAGCRERGQGSGNPSTSSICFAERSRPSSVSHEKDEPHSPMIKPTIAPSSADRFGAWRNLGADPRRPEYDIPRLQKLHCPQLLLVLDEALVEVGRRVAGRSQTSNLRRQLVARVSRSSSCRARACTERTPSRTRSRVGRRRLDLHPLRRTGARRQFVLRRCAAELARNVLSDSPGSSRQSYRQDWLPGPS